MGMTFSTLHLWSAERAALEPLLAPGDLLREQNAPWLSVVPAYDPEHQEARWLEQLAKRLTKGTDGAALLFDYFDDVLFVCSFYRNGKKTASCRSGESWAKLGKQLDTLFGDDAASKALRYASRCTDLAEQLVLLEETVGAALNDIPEDEPRRVLRGDKTLREIKAREAALRKRPNQFALTELPEEDWPETPRAEKKLKELMDARHPGTANWLLSYSHDFRVPQQSHRIAYPYYDEQHRDYLALFDGRSGQLKELGPFAEQPVRALYRTGQGELVMLFYRILQQNADGSSWSRSAGGGAVVCLDEEGGERWRFAPELKTTLTHAHTSPEGIITLYESWGVQWGVPHGAQLWRIDGETGEILYSRRLPEIEHMLHLSPVEALDAFVYANRETKELVLLDGSLEEKSRWGGFKGYEYFLPWQICGGVLWDQRCGDQHAVFFCDLRDGTVRKTPLEIPAYVAAVLPDGRILAVNGENTTLIVFDREGRVISRCRAEGVLGRVWQEPGRVCLGEQLWEGPFGMERGPFRILRLDPAEKKQ